MTGNAAIETVQGLIHLYKTNYGFNITEEGPSDMLLLVHVPVDLGNVQNSVLEIIRIKNRYSRLAPLSRKLRPETRVYQNCAGPNSSPIHGFAKIRRPDKC